MGRRHRTREGLPWHPALAVGLAGWLLACPAAAVPIHEPLDEARARSAPPADLLADHHPLPPAGGDPGSWASPSPRAGPGRPADGSPGSWSPGSPDRLGDELGWSGDLLALGWPGAGAAARRAAPESLLSLQGLRDALLATPWGEDVLQVAVEVLSPAFDAQGNIHVSLFGHGDYVLPSRAPGTPAAAPGDPLSGLPAPALTPPGPSRRVADPEQAVTLSELVSTLAEDFASFLTHPVTVLFALFGGAGYLAVRYAIERGRLRRRRARRTRVLRRRHGSGGQRRLSPSRSRLRPSP